MRIVIDMQGAQTESRFRGIGRYTLSLTQAIVRNRGEHEIILALSGLFPDTIESIRAAFDGILPQENIRVWNAPGPVRECATGNDTRREVAELLREAFLASLQPDVIHINSLFEGYGDDAVTSIGRFDHSTQVSVTLHDLIPLLNADHYLKPNPRYQRYYLRKIEYLKRATIFLAVSDSSREEGILGLGRAPEQFINTQEAVEPYFQRQTIDEVSASQLWKKFGIIRPFVLYTGGSDERKNLPRLIEAFATLHSSLRESHQLLLAGKMSKEDLRNLQDKAKLAGLKSDDLCFTGYVTDEELVQLYNLCELFVFPSWHEGFGLPALEAMACGAPVIGANTSSIPEVIGLDAALFDPFDVAAISEKIARVLKDKAYCSSLRENGLRRAKLFSWEESARRVISAWESLDLDYKKTRGLTEISRSGSKLTSAVAKCLPDSASMELTTLASCLAQNSCAGIERQLMLDISELAQRDSATGVQRVVRSYLMALLQSPPPGFRIEPVYATRDGGYRYARNFVQRFQGKDEEQLADDPVQWQRGDIFFGLDMQHHVQLAHASFYQQLRLDGVTVKFLVYDLLPIQLANLFNDENAKELHEAWLAMIASTDEAVCISKATSDAYENWIVENSIRTSPNFKLSWVHIGGDIDNSSPSKGLPADAPSTLEKIRSRNTFLCVSTLEPRKGQQQIVEALELLWNEGVDLNLVLVGKHGWKIETLAKKILAHPEYGQRLFWLQGISDEYLEEVYAASTCLIIASINEGFGLPLIEAARYGIPIIARDIPVFHEVAKECALYFAEDTSAELATTLKNWLGLYKKGLHPRSEQMRWATWQESAEKLKQQLVLHNYPRKQLLVDISELVQRDARSGIQRVVRNILKEWLNHPPAGYRVEPVYATTTQGYRYARNFAANFSGNTGQTIQDEFIEYAPGDVFFGLDLQPQVVQAQKLFYQVLRAQGIQAKFLVHDLLCIQMPQYFPHGSAEGFAQWLEVVSESDGAVCISKTVANDLIEWVKAKAPARHRSFEISWSHIGADINNERSTEGLPPDAEYVFERLRGKTSFLLVGTIEPRKGHAQVLDAFEQLWRTNFDVNLVIVGKQGWMVEDLAKRLRAHPEFNERLFWLEGISDEYLEKIYDASSCLIFASYGEGFGLPLIEAAQHGMPIIARNIPVFQEVAAQHAYYFEGMSADALAQAIRTWVKLHEVGQHPRSSNMPWMTWKASAQQLTKAILPPHAG